MTEVSERSAAAVGSDGEDGRRQPLGRLSAASQREPAAGSDRVGRSLAAFRLAAGNRELRTVQVARLVSVTGRWAYTIALAVYAFHESGATGVAAAGLVRLLPAAVAAPLAGPLIRRGYLGRLLAGAGLARTCALAVAGFLLIQSGGPAIAVYALVAVESAASATLRPAQNTLLPALAQTPYELSATNLVLSVIESAGVFLGPLIGAALLHRAGLGVVFVVAAGSYLVSLLLLLRVPQDAGKDDSPARRPGFLAELGAGVVAVAKERDATLVVVLYGAQNLTAGALNVLIVIAALKLFGLGQAGVGTLTAAVGVGGIVGGGLVLLRLRRARHALDLALGLSLWGVSLVLLAALDSATAAFALLVVIGIGVTLVDVASVTLLQRSASRELLPHALGLLQTVFVATVAAGTALAPVLASALGVRGALVVTGLILLVLVAASWRRVALLDAQTRRRSPYAALLDAIPIFSPLPDAALEQLAAALVPVALPAGEVVFEQGEPGEDGFYVVESGQIDVLRDGEHVATTGAGGYFGEIALLRDVPRTATIRTRTDVRLLRLDRGRFLAAVTGSAASADAADTVVLTRMGSPVGFGSY